MEKVITENQLASIVAKTIKSMLQESDEWQENIDDIDPLGLNLKSEEDENSVLEEIKGLCEDGIQYFYSMLSTIQDNTFAKNNPEKFQDLLDKVNGLCNSIEEILYYEFK